MRYQQIRSFSIIIYGELERKRAEIAAQNNCIHMEIPREQQTLQPVYPILCDPTRMR